jgi:type III secretion protein U
MSEKTEQPTDHRIRQAREDGQVAKSKDFTEVLLMGALVGYTLAAGPGIFRRFAEMITLPGQLAGLQFGAGLALAGNSLLRAGVEILLPYLLIVIVVGVLAEAFQTGMLVSFKALMPKGDKLNPVTNLQQMFSKKNLMEFAKSCLKVVVLTAIVFLVVRDAMGTLVKLPLAGVGTAGAVLTDVLWTLFQNVFLVFAAIGLADLAWQRHQYIKGLMMSVEEIKQEYKQQEGDPHMKGHRKELAKEIVMGEAVQHARQATAVVTNPTHLAVALFYESGKTPLPVVLAMGAGVVAEAMKRAAEEAGVPVIQDIPLARGLVRRARAKEYIPSDFIEPVAQLLLAVQRLRQQREWEAQEPRHDL